jgi:hypothetical protein
MGLDIRLPLGLIFLITGAIMLVYGLATHGSPIYAVSMGINLNVIWGSVMTAFGIVMTLLGKKRS